jgi:hypothetical protein
MPKPQVPRFKTSLMLPAVVWKQFRMQCLADGRPAHVVVTELLEKYLAQRKGGR